MQPILSLDEVELIELYLLQNQAHVLSATWPQLSQFWQLQTCGFRRALALACRNHWVLVVLELGKGVLVHSSARYGSSCQLESLQTYQPFLNGDIDSKLDFSRSSLKIYSVVAPLLDVSAGLDGDVHRRRAASGHRRHRRKEDHRLLRAGVNSCS